MMTKPLLKLVEEVDARQRSIENTFERDVQKLEMAVRRKVSVYKGKLSERETEASRYEATIDDAKEELRASRDEAQEQFLTVEQQVRKMLTQVDADRKQNAQRIKAIWRSKGPMLLNQMKGQVKFLTKGRKRAMKRHTQAVEDGEKAATDLQAKMDKLKARMTERLNEEKAVEKAAITETDKKQSALNDLAKTVLKKTEEAAANSDKTIEGLFKQLAQNVLLRQSEIEKMIKTMNAMSENAVSKVYASSNADRANLGLKWREYVASVATQVESLEEVITDGLKILQKEVEKHYMTLDMESSTLGAEIEKITESITETGEFVKDAKSEFQFGKDAFLDMVADMKDILANAGETWRGRIAADLTALTKNAEANLQSKMTSAHMSGSVKLAEAEEKFASKLASDKTTLAALQKELLHAVADGNTEARNLGDQLRSVQDGLSRGERKAENVEYQIDGLSEEYDKQIEDGTVRLQEFLADKRKALTDGIESIEKTVKGFPTVANQEVAKLDTTVQDGLAEFDSVVEQAQANLDAIDQSVAQKQSALKRWLKTSLADTDKNVKKTGKLINQVLPALQKFASGKARATLGKLEQLEATLKASTQKAVHVAHEAAIQGATRFTTEGQRVKSGMVQELTADQQRMQKAFSDMTTNLDQTVSTTISSANALVALANEAKLKAQRTHSNILGQTDQVVDEMRGLHKQKAAQLSSIERDFDALLVQMKEKVDAALSEKVTAAKRAVKDAVAQQKVAVTEKAEAAVSYANARENEVAAKAAETESTYDEKAAGSLQAIQALLRTIKGEAVDATEASAQLSEVLKGESAQARTAALAGSRDRLEQTALIEKEFNLVASVANQDATGLSEMGKSLQNQLIEAAKKEALAIVSGTERTAEQKEAALKALKAELHEQFSDIQAQEKSVAGQTERLEAQDENFAKEAEERVRALTKKMKKMDDAHGVVYSGGRESFQQTQMTVEELLKAAEDRTFDLQKGVDTRLAGLKDEQESEGTLLRQQLLSRLKSLLPWLTSQASSVASLKKSLTAEAETREGSAERLQGQMEDFNAEADEQLKGLAAKLGAVTADRQHRLSFLGDWSQGFHTRTATVMEKLMEVVNLILSTSTKKYKTDMAGTTEFMEDVEELLKDEGIQGLFKIKRADDTVDRVLKADQEMKSWTELYDSETSRWRGDVLQNLQTLVADIDAENALAANHSGTYDGELSAAEKAAQEEEERRLQEEAAREQGAVDAARAEEMRRLNEARGQLDADKAADGRSAKQLEFEANQRLAAQKAAEEKMLNAQANIEAFISKADGPAKEAAMAVAKVLEKSQQGVDDAQQKVKDKIDALTYVATGSSPDSGNSTSAAPASSLREGTALVSEVPPVPQPWAPGDAAEVQRSDALLAEHARLEAKAKALEREAALRFG